jgi:hypothetical protein
MLGLLLLQLKTHVQELVKQFSFDLVPSLVLSAEIIQRNRRIQKQLLSDLLPDHFLQLLRQRRVVFLVHEKGLFRVLGVST